VLLLAPFVRLINFQISAHNKLSGGHRDVQRESSQNVRIIVWHADYFYVPRAAVRRSPLLLLPLGRSLRALSLLPDLDGLSPLLFHKREDRNGRSIRLELWLLLRKAPWSVGHLPTIERFMLTKGAIEYPTLRKEIILTHLLSYQPGHRKRNQQTPSIFATKPTASGYSTNQRKNRAIISLSEHC
jgi:hypothetical protein